MKNTLCSALLLLSIAALAAKPSIKAPTLRDPPGRLTELFCIREFRDSDMLMAPYGSGNKNLLEVFWNLEVEKRNSIDWTQVLKGNLIRAQDQLKVLQKFERDAEQLYSKVQTHRAEAPKIPALRKETQRLYSLLKKLNFPFPNVEVAHWPPHIFHVSKSSLMRARSATLYSFIHAMEKNSYVLGDTNDFIIRKAESFSESASDAPIKEFPWAWTLGATQQWKLALGADGQSYLKYENEPAIILCSPQLQKIAPAKPVKNAEQVFPNLQLTLTREQCLEIKNSATQTDLLGRLAEIFREEHVNNPKLNIEVTKEPSALNQNLAKFAERDNGPYLQARLKNRDALVKNLEAVQESEKAAIRDEIEGNEQIISGLNQEIKLQESLKKGTLPIGLLMTQTSSAFTQNFIFQVATNPQTQALEVYLAFSEPSAPGSNEPAPKPADAQRLRNAPILSIAASNVSPQHSPNGDNSALQSLNPLISDCYLYQKVITTYDPPIAD